MQINGWNPEKNYADEEVCDSPFNHAYQADNYENLQGLQILVCKTALDGLLVYVAKEPSQQRNSTRLGEKEALGKKVT